MTSAMVAAPSARLSTRSEERIDAVAIGSPHLSLDEVRRAATRCSPADG